MSRPLAIDLFCGLGGWSAALIAEGWRVTGYDIERHEYGEHRYPGELVIHDVLTLHGSQFKDAALIVASPPCQAFSYMAMPWSKAKAKEAAIEADTTGEMRAELTALFDACFRIQREACEAAGRHIPLVVENVRGAQKWVGRSRWNFGSFHLWGDVPALMPTTFGGSWFNVAHNTTSGKGNNPDGRKQGGDWFAEARVGGAGGTSASYGSKSPQRKMASAMIAKIPEPLARHIARAFLPAIEALPMAAE